MAIRCMYMAKGTVALLATCIATQFPLSARAAPLGSGRKGVVRSMSKRVRILAAAGSVMVLAMFGPLVWRVVTVGGSRLAANRRLINAVLRNDTEGVRAALKSGADPNAEMEGWAFTDFVHPLTNAMTGDLKKHLRDTPLLLVMDCVEKRDLKATDGNGIPLENLATVTSLVDAGADIDARNNIGSTALYMAAEWGYTGTAHYLLVHKANANIRDSGGTSPLQAAAVHGDQRLVTELLDCKADPNTKDLIGMTPLMWTTVPPETPGHIKAAKILAERGADLSPKDDNGMTALAQALVGNNHPGIVKLLQQHGAK